MVFPWKSGQQLPSRNWHSLGLYGCPPPCPEGLRAPGAAAGWLGIPEGSIKLVCSWHLRDEHYLTTTAAPLRKSAKHIVLLHVLQIKL